MKNFVIYFHRKLDTKEVFYVGKGDENRPYVKRGRSKWWKNIVKKHGYYIEIPHNDLTENTAFQLERHYIALFGRKDQGKGPLVNLTDGGEGICNASASTRLKLSLARRGKPLSAEHRAKIGAIHRGKKISIETRKKMSAGRVGSKHPKSKTVLNLETGIFYQCAREAAQVHGINYDTLKNMLNGNNRNKTQLIYA